MGNSRKWCGVSKTQVLLSIHPGHACPMWTSTIQKVEKMRCDHVKQEDILFKALNVQTRREDEYCQKFVLWYWKDPPDARMEKFKKQHHYNWTRYYT